MQFHFDLISDLHLETWDTGLNWDGQATSPICIIAGDVARNRDTVCDHLARISKNYQMTFFIDGNDEHKFYMDNLPNSYRDIMQRTSRIKNLCYLHDNVVVLNGVAILATNGWFNFEFDPYIDPDFVSNCWKKTVSETPVQPAVVAAMAKNDSVYLKKSLTKLQKHRDVKKIVMVTHTVPRSDLINHDLELINTWKFNVMGNSHLNDILDYDTENKIHTWCFGHYHGSVDRIIDNVRYVNNCRGRWDTKYRQPAYFPKRITINF